MNKPSTLYISKIQVNGPMGVVCLTMHNSNDDYYRLTVDLEVIREAIRLADVELAQLRVMDNRND